MSILKRINEEINFYQSKNDDYKSGVIDPNIRGVRSIMGVYPERQPEKYMTRIKTPGGIISVKQLQEVSKIAGKYSHGQIHLTTRQDIQFQGVELDDTVKIMREALEIGIDTLGAGGNSARNVACSPLSGVDKDEAFDVTQYALKTARHLLEDPTTVKLPRKYKVSFSNTNADTAYSTIVDLGFIAKIEDGKKGFEVYGAGGLGGAPTKALKLEDFIEAKDVLYYVHAMKELFYAEGDRQNRNKARIRFIVARLGEEKFRELLNDYLTKVKKELQLDLIIEEETTNYQSDAGNPASNSKIIIEQKQKGYYSVYIHTQNGYIETKDLNKVLNYVDGLGYDTTLRLSNNQGFYVRDIKGKDVDGLVKILETFATDAAMEDIVSCVGETVCGTGLCNSQGLSRAIYERLSKASDDIKSALPKISISGCPNSCGQHQIAKIGFTGKAIKGEDGMIPSYRVFFGGVLEANKTKLGEAKGEIAAKKIPEFLYRLASLAAEGKYDSFDNFTESSWAKIEALIKEFEVIEKDPQLYYDFDSSIKFLSKK